MDPDRAFDAYISEGVTGMTCEHCGKFVEPSGGACPACGLSLKQPSHHPKSGKVVPFRPRPKTPKKAPVPGPGGYRHKHRTLWWILAILVIAIAIPYVWSIR